MDAQSPLAAEALAAPETDPLDETLAQSEEGRRQTAELSRVDQRPPGLAPGFDLIRPVGTGAYGSVWLAKERKTGRFAAVKFFSRRGQDWALLGREVEKLAALDSSHHIVGLIDVGWDADPPYYAMEYLPHGSLAAYLKSGRLAPAEAVDIARDVLRGLVHAHGSGILHCDLKPANILLDQDFHPRLCDFGQARLSEEERPALGTLFYMAPEQADLKALPDARWDVYALGALLYHMLTGHPPHRTPQAEDELNACETVPSRLAAYRDLINRQGAPTDHNAIRGVDRPLGEIVQRCLAPSPADRFRNAQSVLGAFAARDRRRSRRPLVALGLVGPLLLLAAMLPFFLTTMRNAELTAKATLVERALESDALAARLLARSLVQELQDRKLELERVANNDRLARAVADAKASGWTDRSALAEFVQERKDAADERRTRLGLTQDTSWFLHDAEGLQRWRDPYKASTHDHDFSFKDYHHGHGVQYDEHPGGSNPEPPDLTILDESHVSTVFRSDATGHYMVAITAPIKNEHGETIAQLGRTQHLWELLGDYEQSTDARLATSELAQDEAEQSNKIEQQLVLIDRRNWQLVAHPWMTEAHVKQLDDEAVSQLQLAQSIVDQLDPALKRIDERIEAGRETSAVKLSHYRDPVGQPQFAPEQYGGIWLAAAYPVTGTDTDWVALVQEQRNAAVASAERMRSQLFIYAGAALAVGGGLIVTFWYFVTQALAERATRESPRAGDLEGIDTETKT